MLKELIQLANDLDQRGLLKEADALDAVIKRAQFAASPEKIYWTAHDGTKYTLNFTDNLAQQCSTGSCYPPKAFDTFSEAEQKEIESKRKEASTRLDYIAKTAIDAGSRAKLQKVLIGVLGSNALTQITDSKGKPFYKDWTSLVSNFVSLVSGDKIVFFNGTSSALTRPRRHIQKGLLRLIGPGGIKKITNGEGKPFYTDWNAMAKNFADLSKTYELGYKYELDSEAESGAQVQQ